MTRSLAFVLLTLPLSAQFAFSPGNGQPGYSAGSFVSAVGSFAQPTSTGNQTITGIPFQPSVVIFTLSTSNTSDGSAAGAIYTMGAATSSGNQFWAAGGLSNGTASYTGEQAYDLSNCIGAYSSAAAVLSEASLVSMNSNGFTVNWGTVDATARIVNYVAIGGLSNAFVGQLTYPTTTGNSSTTGIGFKPDVVLVFALGTTAVPPATAQAQFKFGTDYFNSTQSGSTLATIDTGATSSFDYQVSTIATIGSSGSVFSNATFVSMDSNGFTLDFTTALASTRYSFYLALKGIKSAIGTLTQPSSTGTQTISGLGLTPAVVLLSSANKTTSTSVNSPEAFSFGAANSTNEFASWYGASSGSNPVNVSNNIDRANLIKMMTQNGASPTLNAAASLSSFASGSFTINWGTVDATAREVYYLALGN